MYTLPLIDIISCGRSIFVTRLKAPHLHRRRDQVGKAPGMKENRKLGCPDIWLNFNKPLPLGMVCAIMNLIFILRFCNEWIFYQ